MLLNPATGVTAKQNYSWNYERAFTAQGRPWCAVTMPHSTLIDIQTSGEYLVYAIRHEYATRRPTHRSDGAQPGRHVHALGAALLAGHPRDGR